MPHGSAWLSESLASLRRLWRSNLVKTFAQLVVVAICLWYMGKQLVPYWSEIVSALEQLNWRVVLASFLVLLIGFLVQPSGMVIFTRDSHYGVSYRQSASTFFGSQPMKYLPGGLWVFPSRILLLKNFGFSAGLTSVALAGEMISQVASSILVGLLALSLAFIEMTPWLRHLSLLGLVGSLGAISAFILSPGFAVRMLPEHSAISRTFAQLAEIPPRKRVLSFALAIALYAVMWLIMGVSFYLLLLAIHSPHVPGITLTSIGVFSLSWFAGFVSFVSPGGIGVRESTIILMLSPLIAAPFPVLAAILLRLFWSLAEAIFFVAAVTLFRVVPEIEAQ